MRERPSRQSWNTVTPEPIQYCAHACYGFKGRHEQACKEFWAFDDVAAQAYVGPRPGSYFLFRVDPYTKRHVEQVPYTVYGSFANRRMVEWHTVDAWDFSDAVLKVNALRAQLGLAAANHLVPHRGIVFTDHLCDHTPSI